MLASYREKLREQNALSDEIVEAMNSVAVGNQVDEEELEEELEQMQQEALDEQMTKTGTVPVSDTIHKLPAAANGPRKSFYSCLAFRQGVGNAEQRTSGTNRRRSQGQGCRGRRRGRGTAEAASRDGYVGRAVLQRNHHPERRVVFSLFTPTVRLISAVVRWGG
jgi:charged multivesicular body protein 4